MDMFSHAFHLSVLQRRGLGWEGRGTLHSCRLLEPFEGSVLRYCGTYLESGVNCRTIVLRSKGWAASVPLVTLSQPISGLSCRFSRPSYAPLAYTSPTGSRSANFQEKTGPHGIRSRPSGFAGMSPPDFPPLARPT